MLNALSARLRCARPESRIEIAADGAIHAIGLVAGLAGSMALVLMATTRGGAAEVAVVLVYLCGLLAMLSCSAAYNLWRSSRRRDLLHRLDHTAIFIMIAGTYTPFTVLLLDGRLSVSMTALVWAVAAVGIAMRLWLPGAFRRCRIGIYLGFGWVGLMAIEPLMGALDGSIIVLLGVGGLLYTVGTVFHVWTALPFQNSIWHGFVLAGASVHYAAVFNGVVASSAQLREAAGWLCVRGHSCRRAGQRRRAANIGEARPVLLTNGSCGHRTGCHPCTLSNWRHVHGRPRRPARRVPPAGEGRCGIGR